MFNQSHHGGSHALPLQPNLEHLKNDAKDRLSVLRRTAPKAKLADAQLAVAREYGFSSWRALKDEIERRGGGIDSSAPLSAYVGFYRYAPGVVDNFVITIMAQDEHLVLQTISGPKLVLKRQADGWFATPGLPTRYGFADLKHGQAVTLCMATDGRRNRLARIDAAAAAREKAANAAAVTENARPRHQAEIAAEKLSRYAGHYVSPLSLAVEILSEAGRLFARLTGVPTRLEIFPESETDFFFRVMPAQISFLLENQRPRTLLLRQQDGLVSYFYPASSAQASEVTAAIEKRLADQRRPRTVAPVDAKLLAHYAGLYRLNAHRVLTVTAEEGHLFAQMTDQDRHELYPESPQDFFFTVTAAQVTFITDEKNHVSHAVLHQAGRDIPLVRMDAPADGGCDG